MNTIKTYIAQTDIARNTIVKFGADEDHVTPATAGTDNVIGVTLEKDVKALERVDVNHLGLNEVKFGGTVAAGESITANADGQAVKAEDGNVVIGYALRAAAKDDIALAVICRK